MPTTRHFNTPLHLSAAVIVFFLLSGCAAYNRIQNTPTTKDSALLEARDAASEAERSDDILLLLAFSGGGTRATAFSYGVLEELRDTRYSRNGRERRLLDEVDTISSVTCTTFATSS